MAADPNKLLVTVQEVPVQNRQEDASGLGTIEGTSVDQNIY